ncbi:nucleotide-binding universal stress UspA family protein [Brevibacterium sanguinis]|uniref:Nucleotide-binding universal stress UspA family protein n=2 Tax=Brevibacterium TaxID=1696 RepID=A0A366II78_9MICO|nr:MULTISPECIES: universal stress protein [Brevibacterium]RBP65064.1 nucleotide-binding universal stress UspA family protein [Brevibacterium sanguinis]RBP71327.1 nucleotide-binding universal stress UspA family protein [Brevibacterium celere]
MTLIAAFPYGRKDRSALRLAAVLARSSGHPLRIVSVIPAPGSTLPSSGGYLQFAEWSRERGKQAVAEAQAAAAEICPDLDTHAVSVSAESRARALIAEAEKSGARMIVVGSGTDGKRGRVRLSSTSDRLLHSSPVPVALAPREYDVPAGSTVTRVTCSYRGDEHSRSVLLRTAEIARDVGADLRIATFAAGGRTVEPSTLEEGSARETLIAEVTASQETALTSISAYARPGSVATVVGTGRDWAAAVESVDWVSGEVLVLGSSDEGPKSRLFLGSDASKIIRSTPVPVVVVP